MAEPAVEHRKAVLGEILFKFSELLHLLFFCQFIPKITLKDWV